jgi:HAD superfamily phosphatase (TIGR01668 family)
LKWLYPDLYVDSLLEIKPEMLVEKGIKALILDLDNTLVARGRKKAEPEVVKWLKDFRQRGFKLCIVSNSTWGRSGRIARMLGLPSVFRAVKPRRQPFRKALLILGTRPQETAVVGDQLFTDVLGGNRLGLYTIMVPSLGGPDFILTRLIIRRIERLLLPRIKARRRVASGGEGDCCLR